MSTADQTQKSEAGRGFLGRNILLILCAVMAIGSILFAAASVGNADRDVAESKAALEQARQETKVLQEQASEGTNEVVKEVSGVDLERKSQDDERVSELMGLATTWSSGEEYNENRDEIMRRFNLEADSAFLDTFMPDQRCRTSSDGTEICMIDTEGLASDFVRMSTSIIGVEGSNYTYFGVATISTPSADGSVSISTQNPVIYTVDGQGTIIEITPYAISGAGDDTVLSET